MYDILGITLPPELPVKAVAERHNTLLLHNILGYSILSASPKHYNFLQDILKYCNQLLQAAALNNHPNIFIS